MSNRNGQLYLKTMVEAKVWDRKPEQITPKVSVYIWRWFCVLFWWTDPLKSNLAKLYIYIQTYTHVYGSLRPVLGVTRLEGSVVSHWHQTLTLQAFLCIQPPSLGSCRVWPLTQGGEVIFQPFTNHSLPSWAARPPHQQLAGESTHSLSNHLKGLFSPPESFFFMWLIMG